MNPFEIIGLVVAIMIVANYFKNRRLARENQRDELRDVTPRAEDSADNHRLRDEVQQIKNRIQVLERIAVEKENSLAREIDQLRDR